MCLEWSTFWSAVSAIASSISALTIFFTIFLAWRRLSFDAWLKAQELWTADDFTKKRSRILARGVTGYNNLSLEEEADALDVCRKMDELARIPFLSTRKAIKNWGVPLAQSWLILKRIVEKERVKCQWSSKWDEFEKLGDAAVKSPDFKKSQPE